MTYKEIDDLKVVTPDANEVTLFYTNGTMAFKDESGDVYTLVKQSDLDAIEAAKPKVYRALLTQTGTNAPTAIVLENTLGGEVVWSYEDVGKYRLTLINTFTANKTIIDTPYIYSYSSEPLVSMLAERVSDSIIEVYTGDLYNIPDDNFVKFTLRNSILNGSFLKIEVYP